MAGSSRNGNQEPAVLTLAPSYVAKLLHIDNLALGGGVVFLMLAASAAAQAILRGLPQRSAMLIGLLFLTAGLGGVVLAAPLGSASLMFGGAAITGIGQGLAYLGCLALLNQIAPQHQRGEVTSCFYIATYLGVALRVLGVGFGAQLVGLFVAVAAFASTIGAVSLLLMAACWLVQFR
jgi:MFS family permease